MKFLRTIKRLVQCMHNTNTGKLCMHASIGEKGAFESDCVTVCLRGYLNVIFIRSDMHRLGHILV